MIISNGALRQTSDFAESLYRRIKAMAKRIHLGRIMEIQLDCDWTGTTRPMFFDLCRQMCQLAHKDSIAVSSTIHLHQLGTEVPPVDRGVLMLCNTGNIRDPEMKNSILHSQDVAPYIKKGINYDLPLSLAIPTYEWGLVFSHNRFERILHETLFNCERHPYHPEDDGEVYLFHQMQDIGS